MQRKDRLFQIIQIMRDGKLHKAQNLSHKLDVSIRTIYRDMDTLIASGVPIEGERGIGYMATAAITLPPLNLTKIEWEALHMGLIIISKTADEDLCNAANSLSAKLSAVMPEGRHSPAENWSLSTTSLTDAVEGFRYMPALRNAIRAMQKVSIIYDDTKPHVIRPLELDYWGRLWTIVAWCETNGCFQTFRVDKITQLHALPANFVDEQGKSLADYHASLASTGKT